MAVGLVLNLDPGEVGLTGHRAQRGDLLAAEPHERYVRRRVEHLDVLDGVAHCLAQHVEFHTARLGVPGDKYDGGAMLTDDQRQQYERDGFLVLDGFAPPEAVAALKQRALQLVDEFEPSEERTIFTTDQQERVSNREFLASGPGIWCFFEEQAFGAGGQLNQDKRLSINKIGHAMHDLDPVFEAFSYTPELADVAADLGVRDALALQSMYIFKQPHIGGEVGCHQDATFLYTEPLSVTGFWFAIEDATLENGCLWVERGGHLGPLRQLFRRDGDRPSDDAAGTRFVTLDDTPLPDPPAGLMPLEVEAGTMVVLHGLLPHWSDVNRSPRSRHAYSLHCISGSANYPGWNWLQRPASMPLRALSLAGSSSASLTSNAACASSLALSSAPMPEKFAT